MNAANVAWAITMAILTVAAICLWRENRRWHQDRDSDRLGRLIDDTSARFSDRRDEGNQNLAWPPQAQAAPLIEKLPPRIARDECGCLWFQGGLWSPCGLHDTGILQAHIDTYADQWAWDLTEEDM